MSSDSPDFDTLAVEALTDQAELLTPDDVVWYDALKTRIAEQLRLVWNARGAADIAKLALLNGVSGPSVKVLDQALRSLDR